MQAARAAAGMKSARSLDSAGRRACALAQRHLSSPRIRQNSRLCIRPCTRRHPREPNVCGSVYSRWWATSWRKVSKSSSSGRRPSTLVVRVNPDEPARFVVAPEHAPGGPGIDFDHEVHPADVDLLQPVAKSGPRAETGGSKRSGRNRAGRPRPGRPRRAGPAARALAVVVRAALGRALVDDGRPWVLPRNSNRRALVVPASC